MRIEGVGIRIAILSAFALCAGARAQTEGSPVLMEGRWEANLSVTTQTADGIATKYKTKVDLAIADYGTVGLCIGSIQLPTGQRIPGMSGGRFARSFSAEAERVSLAAAVKKHPVTGEGISFKGTGIFTDSLGVRVFKITGKRLVGAAAPAQISLLLEDFDAGLGSYVETDFAGASASTLWHWERFCATGVAIPDSLGFSAAAYNRGDEVPPVYNYDTGGPNSGMLQGPAIAVPSGAPGLSVAFDMLRDVNAGPGSFDQCRVEVRDTECGVGWQNLVQVTEEVGCSGTPIPVTVAGNPVLDAFAGKSFLHHFRFDTGLDSFGNALGWYVDNVRIEVANP